MNLLVTNTQCAQAYFIIRELRSEAKRIVVAMHGTNWLRARTTHASRSKYVDARYLVPDCEKDWIAGHIQPENTEHEEAYVRRIEEICRAENIDTIFPSYDPEMYVFAKNHRRFRDQGILVVGPDYERLQIPLDKHASVVAAEKAGLPCPRSIVPSDMAELREVAPTLGPPWVIKPRYTHDSRGLEFVDDPSMLEAKYAEVDRRHHKPMLQELIPGWGLQNLYVMVGRDSRILSVFAPEVTRTSKRLIRNSTAVCVSRSTTPFLPQIQELVRNLGWCGGLTIQMKIDARDDTPKLMEINPRLGSSLWLRTELGVNEPLTWLRLARGEDVREQSRFPDDVLLLQPIDDILNLALELADTIAFRFRTRILGREPIDRQNPPRSMREVIRAYLGCYLDRRPKVMIPYTRYLLSDPLPCLLWYYQAAGYMLRKVPKIGR